MTVATNKKIEDISIYISKIISYNAETNFTYYYPRVITSEQIDNCVINLGGLKLSLDLLIAGINHFFEIQLMTYDEFMESASSYIFQGMRQKITLKDLLYQLFYEEFIHYLRPILQLVATWIQVEAAYDKFYMIDQKGEMAYRIHPYHRITGYKIVKSDLSTLKLQKSYPESQPHIIEEKVFIPTSKTIFNNLK